MNEPQLLLETSARAGQVGLWAHGELRTAALDEARRHARDLASAVRSLLDAASLRPADVRGIVVGLGPGSYTGLRVGVMAAKAFAYATGCTFVGVPTFDAIAAGVGVPCVVIGDALQGMVYVRKFAEPLRIARAADEIPT